MKLLVHPKPYSDESLRGYEWRLAASNGFLSPGEMLSTMSRASNTQVSLASLIKENVLPAHAENILAKKPRCHHRYILFSNYRYCSKCIEESAYFRESWDYALLPYCLEHKRYLSHLPQTPYYFLSTIDKRRVNMHFDSGSNPSVEKIIQLISKSLGFINDRDKCKWQAASGLNANQLQYFVVFVGAYAAFKERYQPRKAPIKSGLDNVKAILHASSDILSNWPSKLDTLVKIPNMDVEKPRQVSRCLDSFYKFVHLNLSEPCYRGVLDDIGKYVTTKWPDIVDKKSPWLGSFIYQYNRFESGTEYIHRNHISLSTLIQWIEQGLVKGTIRLLESNTRQITVERGQDEIATKLRSRFTLTQLSENLGLPEKTLRQLLIKKLIKAEKPVPGAYWLIHLIEAPRFLKMIKSKVHKSDQMPASVSLENLMRYYSCNEHTCADLIIALLESKVRFSLTLDKENLLEALQVCLEDYKQWIIGENLISIPEFSKLISIKQEVAYHLVNKGLISIIDKGRLGRFVTKRELGRFIERYVFPSKLAKQYSTSPRYIIHYLSTKGVNPEVGPCVDGCRQYVFSRELVSKHLSTGGLT